MVIAVVVIAVVVIAVVVVVVIVVGGEMLQANAYLSGTTSYKRKRVNTYVCPT